MVLAGVFVAEEELLDGVQTDFVDDMARENSQDGIDFSTKIGGG